VLTFQGFGLDSIQAPSSARASKREIIKIYIGVCDAAWLENKGACPLVYWRSASLEGR
jgi:hypothetical protein